MRIHVMQPVGQYTEAVEDDAADGAAAEVGELGGGGQAGAARDGTKITIGEALEATAFSAGDQPVEPSDAAAIAAAEARASGTDEAPPDGLAARARAAADANALALREEDRATLRDVLAVRHASFLTRRPESSRHVHACRVYLLVCTLCL
jgi:hypothetical protein